jgi:outer membrane protein TolC
MQCITQRVASGQAVRVAMAGLLALQWLSPRALIAGEAAATPGGTNAAVAAYLIDLPTALRLARADNLEVKLAEERLNEARALHAASVAKFLPWVTAGVSYRNHSGRTQAVDGSVVNVDKNSTTLGPTLSAQIDVGNALYATLAARQVIAAATAGVEAQRADSSLTVASGYFELLRTQAVVQANRDALTTSEDYARQLQAGVSAGVIFRGDLLRAQTQSERYRSAVAVARQQQRLASARLAEVLHLDPAIELAPRDDELLPVTLTDGVAGNAAELAQALQTRPELLQAQAQLEAARANAKGVRIGPLIPSIGTQLFVGQLGGGRDGAGSNTGSSRDAYFGIQWRLGPGGLFDFSRTKLASSRVVSAEISQLRQVDAVRRQWAEAQARIVGASEQMTASRSAVAAASETLRLTRERKQLGVGIVLEDLQAQQELVRARVEYLGAIADYNKAQYELRRAGGKL